MSGCLYCDNNVLVELLHDAAAGAVVSSGHSRQLSQTRPCTLPDSMRSRVTLTSTSHRLRSSRSSARHNWTQPALVSTDNSRPTTATMPFDLHTACGACLSFVHFSCKKSQKVQMFCMIYARVSKKSAKIFFTTTPTNAVKTGRHIRLLKLIKVIDNDPPHVIIFCIFLENWLYNQHWLAQQLIN